MRSTGRGRDLCQHRSEIVEGGLVAKPDHAVAVGGQVLGSRGVVFRLIQVHIAIQFDYELEPGAAKIDDERSQGVLAAESQAMQLVTT